MNSLIPATGAKRVRPGRRLSLRQVVDLQAFAYEAAKGLSSDFLGTTDREERARLASSLANLAKSWTSLQDSKREILNRPRAGSRRYAVEKKPKHKFDWDIHPVPIEIDPEPIPVATQAEAPAG